MVRVKGSRKKAPPRRIARQYGRQPRSGSAIAGTTASPFGAGGSRPFSHTDDTPQALITAAKKLFAQKGYEGTSVKELSDAAGANISLVSYHFGGKEGLYRACLEGFGADTLANIERLLEAPKSREEFELRLGLFIDFMLDIFVKEPELSQLAFKESDLETEFVRDVFQNSFLEVFKSIVRFFVSAQKQRFIPEDLDPHIVSSIFFGSLSHYARMDKIGERYFGRTIRDPKTRQRVSEHLKKLFAKSLS